MHLRIETLALNDTIVEDIPDLIADESQDQNEKDRHILNHSDISIDNIQFPDIGTFSDLISNYKGIDIIQENSNDLRKIVATDTYRLGELIAFETDPICLIPPLDKLTLLQKGKCCAVCGKSLSSHNISPHFIMTHGLDCSECEFVWCSKKCKLKNQILHKSLQHGKHKLGNKLQYKKWYEFEKFCHDNDLISAYSVAIIVATILLNCNTDNKNLCKQWESLAVPSVSNTNETWENCYKLFQEVFPHLDQFNNLQSFMSQIGKFNINQRSQQLYFITSLLNHSCEPNVHFEINDKNDCKMFARADISIGDELSITYINPLHNVEIRQKELKQKYGFDCRCRRCETELQQINQTVKPKIVVKDAHSNGSLNTPAIITESPQRLSTSTRRKSSMRSKRPDLTALLKNGQEFDLDIPENLGVPQRRRTSVRFDGTVSMAVEEE